MIFRIVYVLKSFFTIMKYKIIYGKRFSCKFSLRVGNNFRVRMTKDGFVKIGNNVQIRDNVILHSTGGKIEIGDEVFINDNVCFNSKNSIVIKSRTIIGQNVLFYDHDHDYRSNSVRDNYVVGRIYIGEETWIGAQSTILRDTNVGNHCVIGAQTILKDNVNDNSIFYQKREKINKEIIHEF